MELKRTNLKVEHERALLVTVQLPGDQLNSADSLAELESLTQAAGGMAVWKSRQKRRDPHPGTYVGKGKAEELQLLAQAHDADIIIFDNDLTPAQIRELEKITQRKVLDRSELILDIFASRARTHEARLQVELAQLEYTYPRLTRMWSHLDTVVGAAGGAAGAVGGIGTRGPGEKQLEIDRRLVHKRISQLKQAINQIDKRKQRQVNSRKDQFKVSLVGYTNAGKSTLMNLLTGSETLVADQLFATLDTKTRQWRLSNNQIILLSDTVGFVRNLPHHLVASFRATLEEAVHADLLLHVVDVSHPHAELQLQAVDAVLKELDCHEKPTLLVLNKIDKASDPSLTESLLTLHPNAITVSAKRGFGAEQLIERVEEQLIGRPQHVRVECHQKNGRIHHYLHANSEIISQQYRDSIVIFEALIGEKHCRELQRFEPLQVEIIPS